MCKSKSKIKSWEAKSTKIVWSEKLNLIGYASLKLFAWVAYENKCQKHCDILP
jgi:hypothetical protein